ncbi:MAG: peptidoglycan-binding protein [Chitinispirillaceae bacterium]|nr:peptidoglycan-binding protein [Chitinispirillaceae bacterium]
MALALHGVIADAIVGFQTIPGVDAASLLQAGPAKKKDNGGTTTDIPPQGGGFYCFKMGADSSLDFELLGTDYTLQHHSTANKENNPAGSSTIAVWKDLGAKNSLEGVQRRLQILGYYKGIVDGIRGRKTEEATLSFQADNVLRTDGLDTDGTTQNKIDSICTGPDVELSTAVVPLLPIINHVVRRTLVKFERAPDGSDPKKTSGNPSPFAPEIDDRGFVTADTLGTNEKGPALCIIKDTEVRIKILRTCIANDAPLYLKSGDGTKLEIVSPEKLPKASSCIIKLKGLADGSTSLKVMYKKDAVEVVAGELLVHIVSQLSFKVRPYYVTIADTAGNNPKAPADSKNDFIKAFDVAKRIWWQYGITFNIQAWRDKKARLPLAGEMDSTKADFDTVMNTNDTAGNASEQNLINVLFVNKITDAYGITWDAGDFSWPNGIGMMMNPKGITATGIDLAHELGHFFGLANCLNGNSSVHAEDDPDDSHKKKDIWSIRRLMYGGYPKPDRPSDRWAHDVGYGDGRYGCMLTIRNNPKDNNDNEIQNARTRSAEATFYRKP